MSDAAAYFVGQRFGRHKMVPKISPHKTWEDWALHTIDGIHPNETGRDRITQAIAQILEPEKAF
jgi:lysophospholipase L1-like esterase